MTVVTEIGLAGMLHKPAMRSAKKIDEQTGEKTVVSIDEKIAVKIDNLTGAKIAKRIADRIPAVNSVDLIEPIMQPAHMVEMGETMPV